MEEDVYNYDWVYDNFLNIQMIKSIIPTFWMGEDDPEDVKELKNKLDNIKNDAEDLLYHIYKMMENRKCSIK